MTRKRFLILQAQTKAHFSTLMISRQTTTAQCIHRTVTLDYIVVLEGEVVLTLQDGSRVILVKGDTTVQQGTMHSWSNESDKWARVVSVMIPAKPLVIGNKELEAVWPF